MDKQTCVLLETKLVLVQNVSLLPVREFLHVLIVGKAPQFKTKKSNLLLHSTYETSGKMQ
jgi:hypothetical protein